MNITTDSLLTSLYAIFYTHSAAKAPFLAKFKVAKCGTAKVEELNTSEDTGNFPVVKRHCVGLISKLFYHASCVTNIPLSLAFSQIYTSQHTA